MLKKISQLLPTLSEKDYKLGKKFLDTRDFESLQSLVNSALYKIKKKYEDATPEEYGEAVEPFEDLKMAVDEYASLLDISIVNYEDYLDYE